MAISIHDSLSCKLPVFPSTARGSTFHMLGFPNLYREKEAEIFHHPLDKKFPMNPQGAFMIALVLSKISRTRPPFDY